MCNQAQPTKWKANHCFEKAKQASLEQLEQLYILMSNEQSISSIYTQSQNNILYLKYRLLLYIHFSPVFFI